MAKKNAQQKTTASHVPANGRTVLLASLGAASLARRQALKALDLLVAEGQAFRGSLQARQRRIERGARQRIESLRATVQPLAADALEQAGQLRGQLALRLEPLLARTGLELPVALRPSRSARRKAAVAAPAKAGRKAKAKTARKSPVQRTPARRRKVA